LLNLNLIRVFCAVIEEGSVTAAANELNLSQPSVTQSLNILRRNTNDELFVKEGRGIVPTRAALEFYEQVGHLPALVETALNSLHSFIPEQARVTFRLALTDLGQTVFLPTLVSELAKRAPYCSLDIVNLDTQTVVDDLVLGNVDIAVSSTTLGRSLRSEVLRPERYCCVFRRNRFPDRAPSLEELISLPRIVIHDSTGHTLVESQLPAPAEGSVHLSGFAAIPSVVAASDLVAFVPEAITHDWIHAWELESRTLPSVEFDAAVRAYMAMIPHSAASDWFTQWAVELMRGLQ